MLWRGCAAYKAPGLQDQAPRGGVGALFGELSARNGVGVDYRQDRATAPQKYLLFRRAEHLIHHRRAHPLRAL